ncbi:unnamed protein product [Mesocestoides corti]|uniref:C2H2-type domain-containing protein n=1 Tax=Mesocestoides corti TaxID=53468 RepID=A0A0R3UQ28_MESCO|nr:unnamed protein product [Mesocestoides corti]
MPFLPGVFYHLFPDLRPFARTQCERTFTVQSSLISHIAEISRFSCVHCNKGFTKKHYLLVHVEAQHLGMALASSSSTLLLLRPFLSSSAPSVAGLRPYNCPYCSKSFANVRFLKRHMNGVHYRLTPFECTMYHEKFAYRGSLYRHKLTVHMGTSAVVFDRSIARCVKGATPASKIWRNILEQFMKVSFLPQVLLRLRRGLVTANLQIGARRITRVTYAKVNDGVSLIHTPVHRTLAHLPTF